MRIRFSIATQVENRMLQPLDCHNIFSRPVENLDFYDLDTRMYKTNVHGVCQ